MSAQRAYARGTQVGTQQTQGEIMKLLSGRGVTKMATFVDERSFQLAFEHEGVHCRIGLPLPDANELATLFRIGLHTVYEYLKLDPNTRRDA